jgi:hypothetical protein
MPRGATILLCAYLMVWVPMNFAAELTTTLPSIGFRGLTAILELAVHGAVAAIAVAAGWATWSGNQAYAEAAFAVVLSTVVAIQSLLVSSLPRQTKPGDELPLAFVAAVHAGAWVWYLRRRARLSR